MSSSKSRAPTPIGLERSISVHCWRAPGRSTESRRFNQRKNATAKVNTTNSMAMWLGMGYCGFSTLICREARKMATGLPSNQLISLAMPRICSSSIDLSDRGVDGQLNSSLTQPACVRLPPATQQLVNQFDQYGCHERKQAGKDRRSGQPRTRENSIGGHQQQREAAEEFRINALRDADLRCFRLPCGKPRHDIDSLLEPAVVHPGE